MQNAYTGNIHKNISRVKGNIRQNKHSKSIINRLLQNDNNVGQSNEIMRLPSFLDDIKDKDLKTF